MILKDFEEYKKKLEKNGDNGFCMVLATAVAFEEDVEEMQKLYAKHGRRHKTGTAWQTTRKVMEFLEQKHTEFKLKRYYDPDKRMKKAIGGGEVIDINELSGGKTITPNNCWQYLDSTKNYIMFCHGHAIGVREGKVIDWTEGRRHRITAIIEVDKGIRTGLQNWIASL